MTARRGFSIALAVMAGVVLPGCMPKMSLEEMRSMMPERPAELDKLNAFVGKWETTGKASMAMLEEGSVPVTGEGESKWDSSGWFVVGDFEFSMEGFDPMRGHETWTYDMHSKKFRSTWTDSMGSTGIGWATHNEEDNTWKMKATSHGPHGKTMMTGTLKIVDEDTMEWCMTEHAMGGLMKTMEMCGTSTRK